MKGAYKYLTMGICIDDKLSSKTHDDKLIKNFSSVLFIFKSRKNIVQAMLPYLHWLYFLPVLVVMQFTSMWQSSIKPLVKPLDLFLLTCGSCLRIVSAPTIVFCVSRFGILWLWGSLPLDYCIQSSSLKTLFYCIGKTAFSYWGQSGPIHLDGPWLGTSSQWPTLVLIHKCVYSIITFFIFCIVTRWWSQCLSN